jgi:hypothetical protein
MLYGTAFYNSVQLLFLISFGPFCNCSLFGSFASAEQNFNVLNKKTILPNKIFRAGWF